MKILVGSKNKHKVNAVKRAAESLSLDAEVIGVKTESQVSDNPQGHAETLTGSDNRVRLVSALVEADYYIGLESGFDTVLGRTYVINWCTIMNNTRKKVHVSGIQFEKPETSGASGFIGVASNDALTREDIIYTLVRDAFILLRSKEHDEN